MSKLYEDKENKPFSITIADLKEKLAKQYDETYILELLGIDSEVLLERFTDVVIEKYDELIGEIYDDQENEEEDDEQEIYDQDH